MWLEITQIICRVGIFFLLSLGLSLAGTSLAIRLLPLIGLMDQPGGRHIHKKPVPRGGGVAVFIAFFISFAAYMILFGSNTRFFFRLFIPGSALALLGFLDDKYDIPAWIKLLVQIACGVAVYFISPFTVEFFGINFNWIFALIFTVLWVVIIINAFNLIDGLDGLASGVSAISAVCLCCWFFINGHRQEEMIVMLILAGSCLGFLRYNFYPAKIFLGDTGSTFIGFVFAVTGLSSIDRAATATSLLVPILAVGVPVFDVVLAVWRRVVRKLLNPQNKGIMEGDQDHLHHRLFRSSGKQKKTAYSVYLLALALAGLGICFVMLKKYEPGVAFLLLLVSIILSIRHFAIPEIIDSARLIETGIARPRRGLLFNMFHPLIDLVAIVAVTFITTVVVDIKLSQIGYLCIVVPVFVVLCFSRVYRIYWLRTAIGDYYHLALVLLVGICLSLLTLYLVVPEAIYNLERVGRLLPATMLFALLCIGLIGMERFVICYAERFWLYKLMLSRMVASGNSVKTVIYGGGLFCRLFISYHYTVSFDKPVHYQIIGILDDDPTLKNLRVYGFPVLGTSGEIADIYERHHFSCLVIAFRFISDETLADLREFCRQKNIELRFFQVEEKAVAVDTIDA